jgi:hypothetical protein
VKQIIRRKSKIQGWMHHNNKDQVINRSLYNYELCVLEQWESEDIFIQIPLIMVINLLQLGIIESQKSSRNLGWLIIIAAFIIIQYELAGIQMSIALCKITCWLRKNKSNVDKDQNAGTQQVVICHTFT